MAGMGGHVDMPREPPSAITVQQVLLAEAKDGITHAVLLHEAEWKRRAARSRRTGTYMRSITHRVERVRNQIIGMVGSNVFYARYLEEGTGLYGPRNRWIVPKTKSVLRFPQPGNKGFTLAGRQRSGKAGNQAQWVFAKKVRGIRPRRYARDSHMVVRPLIEREMRDVARRATARLEKMR